MALLAAGSPSLGSARGVLKETAVAELKEKENRPWAASSMCRETQRKRRTAPMCSEVKVSAKPEILLLCK